ncbi:twin-arginine translocation signal domain-containing protein [Desulfovibrio inopinatus]|uniref:twin-arginine translocation signal domain-containing protein n=1 Tax=Desulfovibrio inopinatus TaxID=102109 RepID=UPI00054E2768|nr:twin-arginine translocation signal domain-containing protein [Desulfovibrio inopinatus]
MDRRKFIALAGTGVALAGMGTWVWRKTRTHQSTSLANEMLVRILGVEDINDRDTLDLYTQCLHAGGAVFASSCGIVLNWVEQTFVADTKKTVDWDGFSRQIADVDTDADIPGPVLFALKILQTYAVMIFYSSPEGWALCGSNKPPVQNTQVHTLLRDWRFPSCDLPCHAVKRTFFGPPDPLHW